MVGENSRVGVRSSAPARRRPARAGSQARKIIQQPRDRARTPDAATGWRRAPPPTRRLRATLTKAFGFKLLFKTIIEQFVFYCFWVWLLLPLRKSSQLLNAERDCAPAAHFASPQQRRHRTLPQHHG